MTKDTTAVERTKILGYPLFNDLEDKTLQTRNRCMIIVNIIEDNLNEEGLMTQHCLYLTGTYFEALSENARATLVPVLEAELIERKLMRAPV